MSKISVIYHHFPHYRVPVMKELLLSKNHEYDFYGDVNDFEGIKAFKGDDLIKINPISFEKNFLGKLDIFEYEEAVSNKYDATIIIGHINMLGTWRALNLAKKNGLATAYWAHGWLRKESFLKSKIRNFYFNKADITLTYGARAKKIASSSGFNSDKIYTIWNSLDWNKQTSLFNKFKNIDRLSLRSSINMPLDKPILLTISRVTSICYYDWLIKAAHKLRANGGPQVEIWMIGDGAELDNLKNLAQDLSVPLHVKGAIYDEQIIAKQIMAADLVVSPGKVGLTAMHALAYGTPVITHGNFDLQMPEVEALEIGKSGDFFEYGNIDDLALKIDKFLKKNSDYSLIRQFCRSSLEGRFTPNDQVRLIDKAMDRILNVKK